MAGSGSKGGKKLTRLQDLSDIKISGNAVIWKDTKGLVTSRVKAGGYKKVIAIAYNPDTGNFLVEYEI